MQVATLYTVIAAIALAPVSVHATPLYSQPAPTGELSAPGSLTFSFVAPGSGEGLLSFDLNGYRSLDGDNAWADRFFIGLNGVDILSGVYDLGGGGGSVTYFAPLGTVVSATSYGSWNGGLAQFEVPVVLKAGLNSLVMRYEGAAQGLGDEAWGLSNLLITGPSAIPEPATWAMLILGFGLVGLSARRRRSSQRVLD